LQLVVNDTELDSDYRNRAADLLVDVNLDDHDVLVELEQIYLDAWPQLMDEAEDPACTYARFVGIDTYIFNYARASTMRAFEDDPNRYRLVLESLGDGARVARLNEDLVEEPDEVLISARYSWLIPHDQVQAKASDDVWDAIKAKTLPLPPFICLVLPEDLLRDADVKVRPPCALDAAITHHDEWRRGATPNEVVDGDIPRRCCDLVAWYP
jgi:hypothetical protein